MRSFGLRFVGTLASAMWMGGCTLDFDTAFSEPQAVRDASADIDSSGAGGKAGDAGKDTSSDHSTGGSDSGKGGSGGEGGSAVCSPATKLCVGQVPQTCSSAGQWQVGAPCAYVCSGGNCVGVCTPGNVQCNGSTPQSCDNSGAWINGSPCPNVCSAGACVNACTEGTQQCSGDVPQSCVGGAWQSGTACPYLCSAGACTGVCKPASMQCAELTPQSCDATGQWLSAQPCSFLCSAGACTGVCMPGSKQCSGSIVQSCDASGAWQDDKPCVGGQGCCNSSCVELNIDPNNCGTCGNTCNLDHAVAACSEGICKVVTCVTGYDDCNKVPTDGCEVNLQTDVFHCGACSRVCNTLHVASRSCAAGACDSTCALGYGNCLLPAAPLDDDGCERSVAGNSTSCGGCNNNCKNQGDSLDCGQSPGQANTCGCGSGLDCELGLATGNCNPSGICVCDNTTCNRGEACKEQGTVNICTCNNGPACASGETCCQTPSACKNLTTDRDNCGACGHGCPAGFMCADGTCACEQSANCDAGATGTCVGGLCQCASVMCTTGKRCLSGGICG